MSTNRIGKRIPLGSHAKRIVNIGRIKRESVIERTYTFSHCPRNKTLKQDGEKHHIAYEVTPGHYEEFKSPAELAKKLFLKDWLNDEHQLVDDIMKAAMQGREYDGREVYFMDYYEKINHNNARKLDEKPRVTYLWNR